jgi:hypothetical protein
LLDKIHNSWFISLASYMVKIYSKVVQAVRVCSVLYQGFGCADAPTEGRKVEGGETIVFGLFINEI